jgi:hypothetical protein
VHSQVSLKTLLSVADGTPAQLLNLFAVLTLRMIESLANDVLRATDALRVFFHPENGLFVRKQLHGKIADTIMSHGVQLPDLFEMLPTGEAHREFQRELIIMRSLCLKLLEDKR